jgi:IS30 family transposase
MTGLKSPASARNGGRRWSSTDRARLRELVKDGSSLEMIAHILGREPSAIGSQIAMVKRYL